MDLLPSLQTCKFNVYFDVGNAEFTSVNSKYPLLYIYYTRLGACYYTITHAVRKTETIAPKPIKFDYVALIFFTFDMQNIPPY